MKNVQTTLTNLNSPDYAAFKATERAKAAAHQSLVKAARMESRREVKKRRK